MHTQLSLEPHARLGDPKTSHDAARSVQNLSKSRGAVLYMLKRYGPMTQDALVRRYQSSMAAPLQSDSGIRSRVAELVRMGLAEPTGETAVLASGRRALIWAAKA